MGLEDETHATARDEPPELVTGVDGLADERLAHSVNAIIRCAHLVDRIARASFTTLALLYFASGAVGLVDEVIFFKYLSLAFGATAHASSTVLVAFMAGLALGASAAAAWDRRIRRPLLVYGVLEVAVGAACAAAPWLFAAVTRLYVSLATGASSLAALELLRGGLAGAVVVLPTMAMGATLPLVARVGGAGANGERRVATLYGANTAGGALGSLLGSYAVIPALGLAASLRVGACVSVAVGLAAIALSRSAPRIAPAPVPVPVPAPAPAPAPSGLLVAAACSGLLVFASEVVFVHLLALVDGTSVYVFGLVLAVFLVALALGAALSRVFARCAGSSALPASLALSGAMLAATLPVWDRLPEVFVATGPIAPEWWQRELVRGLVAAIAIGLPAACMGMTFPLVLAALSPRDDRGALTGRATAINTIASIAGSLLGGFVLLPALGSQRACGVIALAYELAALAVPAAGRRRIALLAAATGTLVVAAPRWDLARLASGTNVYFERQPEQGRVVWIDEDVHGGVVTVTRAGDVTTLWTNGKYQGDTGWQMAPQRAFADFPATFVPRFGRALVVGMGTGVTLDQTARYPFERIDVAELSPGIVQAARTFFDAVNGRVLDDPRVHVHLEDGRNLLAVEESRYDLVTIELTSIWFAGAANLYNLDFYQAAATKLTGGGVLSQWIQLHHTTLREVASQMTTARAVFRHAAFFVGGQGVLVLSNEPLRMRPDTDPALEQSVVLADETIDAFVDDVAARYGVTREGLTSTDDNLRLEYSTPRNNVPRAAGDDGILDALIAHRQPEVAARLRAR
jgi:spermidine synthase